MTRKKQRQKATNFIRKGTGLSMADSAKIARIFQKRDELWEDFPEKAQVIFDYYYGCPCCDGIRTSVLELEGPKGFVIGKDIKEFFS